jgi:hypothetical protein
MVQNSPPGATPALAVVLGFVLGLASHPANFASLSAVVGGGGAAPLISHELFEESSSTTTTSTTSEVVICPDVNLSRDCPEWPLPPRPLHVVGGAGGTIEVPIVVTAVAVVSAELCLASAVCRACQRRAVEQRKRLPLGEIRLQLER